MQGCKELATLNQWANEKIENEDRKNRANEKTKFKAKRWTHLESRTETQNRISSRTWSKQWSSRHFIVRDKRHREGDPREYSLKVLCRTCQYIYTRIFFPGSRRR
jgi:hypothetical protein